MSAPLSEKNVNVMMDAPVVNDGDDQAQSQTKDVKSMDYHRQMLADKLAQAKEDGGNEYVSPSDGIMSPCTAKLSNLRNKKMDKSIKPKSLFQKASAKSIGNSGSLFGSKSIAPKPRMQPLQPSQPSQPSQSPVQPAAADTETETETDAPPAPESKKDDETEV